MYKAEEKSAVERLATLVVSIPKFYGVEILYSAGQVQNVSERVAIGLRFDIRLHILSSLNILDIRTNTNAFALFNIQRINLDYDPFADSPLLQPHSTSVC